MADRRLTSMELLYSRGNGQVFVYRAWDEVRQKRVCVKEQRCVTIREFNRKLQEGMNQCSLAHYGICKLYECFLKQDRTQLYYVIEMELMERDLEKEISARTVAWPEREFKQMVFVLVDALAYAQEHGVCHRDIGPQNIFLTRNGSVKLGDFGSSIRNVDDEDEIAGSSTTNPIYQCPLLQKQASLGSYQNDVFALGLTFLTMARLKDIAQLLMLPELEGKLREEVETMRYSEGMKSLVRAMLQTEEEHRCDFVELRRVMMGSLQLQDVSLRLLNKCLLCHIRILPSEVQHQVTLKCESVHVFCTQACFRLYLERSSSLQPAIDSACCPKKKCRKAIDKALIKDYFLRPQSYERPPSPNFALPPRHPDPTTLSRICLFCQSPIRMPDIEASFRQLSSDHTVSLPCDESAHVFCSPECVRDYVRDATRGLRRKVESVGCPVCRQPIPTELIYKAFGGRGKLQKEVERNQIRWMYCKVCKTKKADIMLACGHSFCRRCLKTEYEMLRVQGYVGLQCMVCHRRVYQAPDYSDFCKIV